MIGILEYKEPPDSTFINDLMQKVGKPFEWITYHQLPTPFTNDYNVILDRTSFNNEFLNTALKIQSFNGCYVINNPFSLDILNKGIDFAVMQKHHIPYPKTFILSSNTEEYDMADMIGEVDWDLICREFSFPLIIKPILGGGWSDVFVVNNLDELKKKYDDYAKKEIMIIQERINADAYVRVFCIGKEKAKAMKYIAAPFGAGRIVMNDLPEKLTEKIENLSIKFCKAVDVDFNVVEWVVRGDEAFVIDALNEDPDVTKEKIPEEYYNWIVNELAEFIKDALKYGWKNKHVF